jgi:Big-like domain-containing protein
VFANKLVPTASTTVIPHGATATITITVKDGLGHAVPGAKVTASGAGILTASKLTGSTGKATFKVHPTKAGKIKFAATKSGCVGGTIYVSVY